MIDAWQILRDGGLPIATAVTGARRSAEDLGSAVVEAIAQRPTAREADALVAFVLAWQQHWPTAFAAALGSRSEAVLAWARAQPCDANRYLKLRRIAIENLSHVL